MWTLVDFDDTKILMLCLLIKLISVFKMKINIPKLIFTNEHLEPFSSIQIRILNKVIRIPQVILQFWSNSSKFRKRWFESLKWRFESRFQEVQTGKGDSNPSWSDSNPNSSNVVEIDRFESLVKKEVKQRATDLNHPYSDFNPS